MNIKAELEHTRTLATEIKRVSRKKRKSENEALKK